MRQLYNKISVLGDININYIWAISQNKTITETPTLTKPVWDNETIALANFNTGVAASSYEGVDFQFSEYKIYRKDTEKNSLKYIATISSDIQKLKDYTNFADNNCSYLIYPVHENGNMGTVLETNIIIPKFERWTIAALTQTETKNVYMVEQENIWNFWLNPEISGFSQITNKGTKTGDKRYPRKKYSNVNYATGDMSFLIGDLLNCETDYGDDTVAKKNRWVEFANSPTPKILTDPKGECMLVDITPVESSVAYNYTHMPTTIKFKWEEIGSTENITAYCEVDS